MGQPCPYCKGTGRVLDDRVRGDKAVKTTKASSRPRICFYPKCREIIKPGEYFCAKCRRKVAAA